MRKLFLGLVLLVACFVGKSNAQITLVNTSDNELRISRCTQIDGNQLFIGWSNDTKVFKIFNSDFSLNRIVTLDIPNFDHIEYLYNGIYGNVLIGSCHIFNNDNLLEFTVRLKDPTTGKLGFAIVNENSNIVFSKYADNTTVSPYDLIIHNSNSTAYMSVVWYDSSTSTKKTEIYTLPGTERFENISETSNTSNLKSSQISLVSSPYPNPSQSSVNLTYILPQGKQGTLSIYNLAGQILKTFVVDGTFPSVTLDVSTYSAGTYLYNVAIDGKVTASNKFVVSK